jgi:hypothetical protein
MINDAIDTPQTRCGCGHPAGCHVHLLTDGEWCGVKECLCVEFRRADHEAVVRPSEGQ